MSEKRTPQSPQQAALQRLLQAEADARTLLSNAQAQTTKALAEGKVAALRLIDETRAAADAEAAALRADATARAQAQAQQMQNLARQEAEAMGVRVSERLSAAVSLVVEWVKGAA